MYRNRESQALALVALILLILFVISFQMRYRNPIIGDLSPVEGEVVTHGYEEYRQALLAKGLPAEFVAISVQLNMEYDAALKRGASPEELELLVARYQTKFDALTHSSNSNSDKSP